MLYEKADVQLKTSSQSRMNIVLYEGHSIYDCNMRLLRKKQWNSVEIGKYRNSN